MDAQRPSLSNPLPIAGVLPFEEYNQTMEHASTVSYATIAIDFLSSYSVNSFDQNPCEKLPESAIRSFHQLFAEHLANAALHHDPPVVSENDDFQSSPRCSPTPAPSRPPIGSKRVEDVKRNRIDKTRSGRRRRACRRPFVFKSSPLAEGNGASQSTSFGSNPFCHSSKYYSLKSRHAANATLPKPSQANCARSLAHLSPFMGASISSLKLPNFDSLDDSLANPSINTTYENFPLQSSWSTQPQISRLPPRPANWPKFTPQYSHDFRWWEISLPKCPLALYDAAFMS